MKRFSFFITMPFLLFEVACTSGYFKNDYSDNSPTSGKLKVYCDEGFASHAKNQALTFEGQYPKASIEVVPSTELAAIKALYDDSCKAIFISRELSEAEKKSFASKTLNPRFSVVAYSGIAIITNTGTPVEKLTTAQVRDLITLPAISRDSVHQTSKLTAVFDNSQSSVTHYLKAKVAGGKEFSRNCSALNSTMELLHYVSKTPNVIGFIDFALLSDRDDPLFKEWIKKVKLIPLGAGNGIYTEPNQSSFKTGAFPFTRKVYLYTQAPEFSLAKGFQSFVAGPKGQMTFLKQGLLPFKQQERNIEVKLE
jgi:phosphate transport system substrate-binding protein